MSLAQLDSQLDDLRAQAKSIHGRWARTTDILDNDANLTDSGKRAKRDTEREQANAKIRELRKQETELIAAKRQSIEKRLFGLSSVTSSDPVQIIAYRDAQDRAARLEHRDEAEERFAAAMRGGDKILTAAIVARARDAGWDSIVTEYVKQHPDAGDDLADLAEIQRYSSNPFMNGLSYTLL